MQSSSRSWGCPDGVLLLAPLRRGHRAAGLHRLRHQQRAGRPARPGPRHHPQVRAKTGSAKTGSDRHSCVADIAIKSCPSPKVVARVATAHGSGFARGWVFECPTWCGGAPLQKWALSSPDARSCVQRLRHVRAGRLPLALLLLRLHAVPGQPHHHGHRGLPPGRAVREPILGLHRH